MLLEDRELLITSSQVSSLYNDSVSKIIPSSVWLERELSDFSGLSFFGLIDTRRLLLDYLETKQV
jgi:Ni,Fe-hydrogenase III component G